MKDEKKTEQKVEEILEQAQENNEIEKLQAQVEDYKNKWMRSVAEFDNYKKRNAKMWQEAFNEGISSVILKILPVGDNLDWALSIGLDEKTQEGIKNIKKKYDETLKSMDIEEINPLGLEFDPNTSEAVMMVDGEEGEESGVVKQVLQKGYKIKEKVIRYAKVSVIK
ncbi:MAG: nucleotide exchange factor GrpE [Clostridia bacterium]|nr:nucleotide exchange factor GrpE [Clostridia bacterium]